MKMWAIVDSNKEFVSAGYTGGIAVFLTSSSADMNCLYSEGERIQQLEVIIQNKEDDYATATTDGC